MKASNWKIQFGYFLWWKATMKSPFFYANRGVFVLIANFPILCLKPQTENFTIFNGEFCKSFVAKFTTFLKHWKNCCSTLLFPDKGVV